jgi:hypothetical protein
MPQKVTFLLSDSAGYGWSMSFWYLPGGLTGPNTDTQNLLNGINSILSVDCAIDFMRISSNLIRAPFLVDVNPTGGDTGLFAGNSSADFVAVKLRLTGVAGGVGRIFLRGIPQSMFQGDAFTPTPAWTNNFNDFVASLIDSGVWGIQTNAFSGPLQKYAASTLLPMSPRGYSFVLAAGPSSLPVGSQIRMHNGTVVGYNGLKKVTNSPTFPPGLVTVGGASPQAGDPGTNSPYITIITYTYPAIGFYTLEGVTHRPAGRFFGQRRGRRSTTLPLRR